MEFSDSDEDSNGNHAPRVTSLNAPGRVTIGTDGSLEIGKSSLPHTRSGMNTAASVAAAQAQAGATGSEEQARKKQKLQQWITKLTHNGGQHHKIVQTSDKNDITLPIYWSQDRYAVTLRLGFSHLLFPSKSIRVRVTGALNYKDRFSAVGSGAMSGYKEETQDGSIAFGAVEIVSVGVDRHEVVLLSDKLPRPIYLNQDEDEVGFDIEDNNLVDDTTTPDATKCTKFVAMTLPKAVPMEGMIIWWEHALEMLPKIDTSSIQERNNSVERVMSIEEYNASMDKKQSSTPVEASKKEAFAKAWNEAHQMFRERVKERDKQEINVEE